MTLNEPQCFIDMGHRLGEHAPGDKLRFAEVLLATHHTLLAHGRAVQAIRAHAVKPSMVGVAMIGWTQIPATESSADIEATRVRMFQTRERRLFTGAWWSDPIFLGEYPADGVALFGDAVPAVPDGDMAVISQPLDFLGLNIYNGCYWKADANGQATEVPYGKGFPRTSCDNWPITPEALRWGPRYSHERYRVPIVITENGHQNTDIVSLDGKVHDPQRIDYLHRHLRELRRAIVEDGVPVKGYFQWCFTDNFEWAFGDSIRVGIVFTDYETQQRVPKDSAYWYRDTMAANGANL